MSQISKPDDTTDPPASRGARGTRLAVTLIDQAASSASNFLLLLLFARTAGTSDFGLLTIAFGVITFGMAVGRAAFGAMLGMDVPQATVTLQRELLARSTAAVMLLGAAACLPLAIMALTMRANGAISQTLIALTVACPFILVQDLLRYWSVARGRPVQALVSDAIWLVSGLGLLVLDALSGQRLSLVALTGGWIGGLLVALLVLASLSGAVIPKFDGVVQWLRADKRRHHLGADATLASTSPLANSAGVALVAGAATTGAFRGAATLFGPLNVLIAAMSLGLVPEAKRSPVRRARALLLTATSLQVMLAIAWGVGLFLLPDDVGHSLLGQTWDESRPLLLITTAEYVGIGLWSGASAMFHVTNDTRILLHLRLVHWVMAISSPIILIAIFNHVIAVSVALAACALALGFAGVYFAFIRKASEAVLSSSRLVR